MTATTATATHHQRPTRPVLTETHSDYRVNYSLKALDGSGSARARPAPMDGSSTAQRTGAQLAQHVTVSRSASVRLYLLSSCDFDKWFTDLFGCSRRARSVAVPSALTAKKPNRYVAVVYCNCCCVCTRARRSPYVRFILKICSCVFNGLLVTRKTRLITPDAWTACFRMPKVAEPLERGVSRRHVHSVKDNGVNWCLFCSESAVL